MTVHVAIDYTLSNGPPNDPHSLHYFDPMSGMNEYTQAISAVMNIIQDYSTDQLYPCYGFGGRIPGTPEAAGSHCFALNGDIFNPHVNGQKGVLNAYYKSLNKVQLYGPTHFSSILQNVNAYAEQLNTEISQQNQHYMICLILTDGIINDMQ